MCFAYIRFHSNINLLVYLFYCAHSALDSGHSFEGNSSVGCVLLATGISISKLTKTNISVVSRYFESLEILPRWAWGSGEKHTHIKYKKRAKVKKEGEIGRRERLSLLNSFQLIYRCRSVRTVRHRNQEMVSTNAWARHIHSSSSSSME